MGLYFTIWIIGLGVVLSACKPEADEARTATIVAPNEDANPEVDRLKVAFSIEDVKAVEIVPKDVAAVAWRPLQLYAAGQLPDDTYGRLYEDLTWEVSDTKIARIGKSLGRLLPIASGKVTVSVKFRSLDAVTKKVAIRWGAQSPEKLPEVLAVTEDGKDESSVQLSWLSPSIYFETFRVAYLEGAVAPKSCEEGDVETIQLNETKKTVGGLKSGTEYTFLVCTGDSMATEDLELFRFSDGVSLSVTTL